MTVTLDLPPHVEQAYLAAARAKGVPVDEVVRETLIASRPVDPQATARTGAALVAAMQASPSKETVLEPPRERLPVRDIAF